MHPLVSRRQDRAELVQVRASERASARASERASEQVWEQASEQVAASALEQASVRALEPASVRATEQASVRATEQAPVLELAGAPVPGLARPERYLRRNCRGRRSTRRRRRQLRPATHDGSERTSSYSCCLRRRADCADGALRQLDPPDPTRLRQPQCPEEGQHRGKAWADDGENFPLAQSATAAPGIRITRSQLRRTLADKRYQCEPAAEKADRH